MVTPERLKAINEVSKGTEYRSFVIDFDFTPDSPVQFVARIPPDIEIRENTIAGVFNKIDAHYRRIEEQTRRKVGEPALVFHKGEWKEGQITTVGVDGVVRVKIGKGTISLPIEDKDRFLILNDKNKDLLEKLIEYEEMRDETQKSIDEIKEGLELFDIRPHMQILEEEIKAAEEANKLAEEKLIKKAAKEEKKAAKKAASTPTKKLTFVRKK